MESNAVFLYRGMASFSLDHSFWKSIQRSLAHLPQQTCILVPSQAIKSWLFQWLDLKPMQCQTLDEWTGYKPCIATHRLTLKEIVKHNPFSFCQTNQLSNGLWHHLEQFCWDEVRYGIAGTYVANSSVRHRFEEAYATAQKMHPHYPLLEAYRTKQDTIKANGLSSVQSVFVYGFWDLPLYQREVLGQVLTSVSSASLWVFGSQDTPWSLASQPLIQWLHTLPITIRELSVMDILSPLPRTKGVHYLTLEDEIQGVLDLVQDYLSQGMSYSDIGIVCPNQHDYMEGLYRWAQYRHIPIAYQSHPLGASRQVQRLLQGQACEPMDSTHPWAAWEELAIKTYQEALPYIEKFSQDEQIDLLRSVSVPMMQKDGLTISGKFESHGIPKKIWIVTGVTQGKWPGHMQENAFCPHVIKKMIGWPTQDTLICADEYLFFSLAYQARVELVFTRHAQAKDIPVLPSFFLEDYERYFGERIAWHTPEASLHKSPLELQMTPLAIQPLLTGELTQPDALATLQKQLDTHTWSATSLESYQRCPFAYFMTHILHVEPPAQDANHVPHAMWGQFVHHVVKRCLQEVSFKKPLSKEAIDRLVATTPTAGTGLAWDAKKKQVGHTLLTWWETIHAPEGSRPIDIEKKAEFMLGETKFKGQVDAIFEQEDGGWEIVDFKTSAHLPTPTDIKKFRSLQLPVYWKLVMATFPAQKLSSASYIQLRDPFHVKKEKGLAKDKTQQKGIEVNEAFWDGFVTHIQSLIHRIQSGNFSFLPEHGLLNMTATSRQLACRNCGYKSVCRYRARFSS